MSRIAFQSIVLILTLGWGICFATPNVPQTSPVDLVMQTSERMLESIKKEKQNETLTTKRVYDLVEEIVLPHFDFEKMSKLVLGKNWRKATKEEQAQFIEEFTTLLVRTYATAMEEYTDEKIDYLPFNPGSDKNDVVVKTEVDQKSGFPIPIDYRLYQKDNSWKVYDVSIDDVSLVLNYRTSFSSTIRNEGGVKGLIKTLRDRNREAMDE